jgi:hypothetical protein
LLEFIIAYYRNTNARIRKATEEQHTDLSNVHVF